MENQGGDQPDPDRPDQGVLLVAAERKTKERALLLMRYSGLAIQDAAALAESALEGDCLTLRKAKSGTRVLCCLPEPVTEALGRIARPGHEHYFLTGESRPPTIANFWRARLTPVADLASVDGFRTRGLRDRFALGLLAARVAMEDVSVLLSHGTIRTTDHYYAHGALSRRNRLLAQAPPTARQAL